MTVTPRFSFGVKGELRNSLHIVDDKKLLYVSGHNVIMYNIDEQSQYFIPGCDNTERINKISLSNYGSNFLAICQVAERAHCTIYDIDSRKRVNTLTAARDPERYDFTCREFLDASFSPKNDK